MGISSGETLNRRIENNNRGGLEMITLEYVRKFAEKQKTAFIGSMDGEGFPNIKAVFTPRKIEGNSFYFSTNTSSVRTGQYLKNPKASLYFYNRGRFRYEAIMLVGTMEVLQDAGIKEEIWQSGDTMYYKEGVTDPDYCVLKFTAVRGRRYCSLKSEDFSL